MPFHPLAMSAGCLILCTAVMTLAATAIGMECYNKNAPFAEQDETHKNNSKYLLYMLIMAILCILSSFIVIYMAISDKGQAAIQSATTVPRV
jgi:uncharacterized membrane protein YjgN (DUF898 family)